MEKILKKGVGGFVWALLLAALLAVALDAAAAVFWQPLPRLPWLIGAGALFLLLALLPVSARSLRDECGTLLLLLALAALLSRGLLFYLQRGGAYESRDQGKGELYAGQRVLVVVPRQGDELRLAAGVLEAFRAYGSELGLLYTEGEAGETAVAEALGVPASRVWLRSKLGKALDTLHPTLILAARSSESALKTALAGREDSPTVLLGLLREGAADFYAENLLASADPGWYARAGLDWEQRLRLPVAPATLSHALSGCQAYPTLRALGLSGEAESILNGDCVFWPLDGAETALSYLKLADRDGNFVYDYYIDPSGRETLPVYTCGEADQPCQVYCQGEHCSARLAQGRVVEVVCPKGRSCLITVTSADGRFSDTVRVSNPGRFARETAQSLERILLRLWEEALPATNTRALAQSGLDRARAVMKG